MVYWQSYVEALDPVRELLLREIRKNRDLQGLAEACGESPTRCPPENSSIKKVRVRVGKLLGLTKIKTLLRHEASPWFPRIAKAIQAKANDPDLAVVRWHEDGTPFGIAEEIVPGGGASDS